MKVLQTCIMATPYIIAGIIGMVTSFFPLQQIIVCLLMAMTSRRLLHCGQRCVWLQIIMAFLRVLWQGADTVVPRLVYVAETERRNLAPKPWDLQ
jgi:hypothetical protein